jgi:hypothetical protein
MDVSAQSNIDPLIGLFEVEKIHEINLTMDKSPEENKKKGLNCTRESIEACNELVAALVFVQDKVASDIQVKIK